MEATEMKIREMIISRYGSLKKFCEVIQMPWTTLDMSSINDPEQLTGSSRIYANAKTGIIMDAFSMAGESNLVFIINELDKAASGN